MPMFRVRVGRSFRGFKTLGGGKAARKVRCTFGPNQEVELTANQALAFADCLDLVETPKAKKSARKSKDKDDK